MHINMSFLEQADLCEICKGVIQGRILSLNIGKNLCMGVVHINCGYSMFRFDRKVYESKRVHRGDIISFLADTYEHDGKNGININTILDCISCKGTLPNKQFKGETENNRIVQCLFEPEKFEMIKRYSDVLKAMRIELYNNKFDEINTPVLFQKQSPSNAESFCVETVNGQTLYLKSIHEHLIKPYLLLGFERVFEIGAVFRNIGYSHEYDCEFHNLDMWLKGSTLNELIDLCLRMTRVASMAVGSKELMSEVYTFEQYVNEFGLGAANDKKVKEHIRSNGYGKIIIIKEPKRVKNFHIKETEDKEHNQEFHAYINGVSYAHGYCVKTDMISVDESMSNEKCQIFEEYAIYGIEEFGGVGIGMQKMMQGLYNIDDYHLLNLYRRKY